MERIPPNDVQASETGTRTVPGPLWRVQLLGNLRASCGERALEKFQTQKTAALLAYLAFYSHRRHTREELIDLLWPDAEPEAGRNRLSQALPWLRSRIEFLPEMRGTILLADRQTVGLSLSVVSTDVSEFVAAADAGGAEWATSVPLPDQVPALERAVSLYTGHLLPGHYEDWVLAERQRLLTLFLAVLQRLFLHYEQQQEWEPALDYARRALAADPVSEEMHCALMRLLWAGGRPEAALRQFRDLQRILDKELGEAPSGAALALVEQIRRSKNAPVRNPPPARNTQFPVQYPIVRPLTRFFGRDTEVAALRSLLTADDVRLVTLTGTGGMGKTRLALEAASALAAEFSGAVWFVPLADVSDAALIPSVILDALQLSPSTAVPPLKQVSEALSRHPTLLVLDNLEHLVKAAAPLTRDLLELTPTIKILATSRQCLALDGEQEVPLLPLPPPTWENAHEKNIERLMQVESVRLFADRARLVRPAFAVTRQNAEAIAQLCRRLEGLPLAIELCASWAQTLTPAQMLSQLTRRFDLLVSRRADIAPRHRSLRAALEYSYLLLPPNLQQFFVQLSVFRGGWTADAAEAVCLSHSHGSSPLTVLTDLTELRERSLLTAEEVAEEVPAADLGMRYRMLESLREFAVEQRTLAEDTAIRRRHANHFLALAETATVHLSGSHQGDWPARLEAEHDNLRAALSWTVESQDADTGLRLAVALFRFWEIRGYLQEAQQWLERLFRIPVLLTPGTSLSSVSRHLHAGALNVYARVAQGRGDFAAAETYATQALTGWRVLEDASGIASSLVTLGWLAMVREDHKPATELLQEARLLAQQAGDEKMNAQAILILGTIAMTQENWGEASEAFAESLALSRVLDNRIQAAKALNGLGLVARYRGELTAARHWLHEALREHRALEALPDMAVSLVNLATVERLDQRYEPAMAALRQAARTALEIDDQRVAAWCIKEFGHLACAENRWEIGLRLLAASESLRETLGTSFQPADPKELSRDVSLGCSVLGEAAFAAAWRIGSQWNAQEAYTQAIQAAEEAWRSSSAEYFI